MFFYVGGEAPTRAWGTLYKKPKIEKNKMGGTKVVMYLTIGYNLDADDKPLAFVHWLCVPSGHNGRKNLSLRGLRSGKKKTRQKNAYSKRNTQRRM